MSIVGKINPNIIPDVVINNHSFFEGEIQYFTPAINIINSINVGIGFQITFIRMEISPIRIIIINLFCSIILR